MRLKLGFSLEGDVALLAARVVRAHEVRTRKVNLQLLIVVVEHVAEVLAAQVTRQVHPMQVLAEDIAIEEELFTKIAPWMRKDLGTALVCRVSMLNMLT